MAIASQTASELIGHWIEPNPWLPGTDEVRICDTGVPLWALIGHLPAAGNDLTQVASEYELPLEAVLAALAYYQKHRAAIDARLEQNAGAA